MFEYPSFLERYWLENALDITHEKTRAATIRRLEPWVQSLSDRYTRLRSKGIRYNDSPLEWSAYNLFFFPQTYACVRIVLSEIHRRRSLVLLPDRPLRILDLGCGTGAASFAVLTASLPVSGFHITAVDAHSTALSFLKNASRALSAFLPEPVTWSFHQNDARTFVQQSSANTRWDLIILCFAFNEMTRNLTLARTKQWLDRLTTLLAPDGLLLIVEPALKETAETLMQIRDRFTAAPSPSVYIHAPAFTHSPAPF